MSFWNETWHCGAHIFIMKTLITVVCEYERVKETSVFFLGVLTGVNAPACEANSFPALLLVRNKIMLLSVIPSQTDKKEKEKKEMFCKNIASCKIKLKR